MPISKTIKVIDGKSWVLVYEYSEETLVLEGLRIDPDDRNNIFTERIRFTKQAVSKLIPLMDEWLEEK